MDLISQCALRVANLVWRPTHGGWAFTVVCKATFELLPDFSSPADVQEAVWEGDVFGEGAAGGAPRATELAPFKKRPEVMVVGHAHAPDGAAVRSLVARLVVGEVDKAVEVVGDRYFGLDGGLSEPVRFTKMPLVWERAAGGPETSNPVGVAFGEGAAGDFFGRVRAPNLMLAGTFLGSRGDIVAPANLGPIAPTSPMRTMRLHGQAAGWDAARWHEAPLPEGIDVAYFNAAPHDQHQSAPFGEGSLYLEHLHPRFAKLSTQLASLSPVVTVEDGSGPPQPLQVRCDTLTIDSDRGLAMLVWRGHLLLDRPDRPGRVLVNEPALPKPGRTRTLAVGRQTVRLSPEHALPSSALPFAGPTSAGPASAPIVNAPIANAPTFGPPPASAPTFGPPPVSAPPVGAPIANVAPVSAPTFGPASSAGPVGAPSFGPAPVNAPTFGAPPVSVGSASLGPVSAPTFGAPPVSTRPTAPAEAGVSGPRGVTSGRRTHTLMAIGDAEEPKKAVLPFAGPSSVKEVSPAPAEMKAAASNEALPFRPQVGAQIGASAPGRAMGLAPVSTQGEPAPVASSLRDLDFELELDTERPPPPASAAPPLEIGRTPPPPAFLASSEGSWSTPPAPAPFYAPVDAPSPTLPPPAPFFAPVDAPSSTVPPATASFYAPVDSPSPTLPPPAPVDAPSPSPAAAPFYAPVDAPATTSATEPSATAEAEASVVEEASAEAAIEPELPAPIYEEFPAERCGAIAGRLSREPAKVVETLRAEGLNEAGWKGVHERRLEEIRAKAARRDRSALAEYDRAYVAALEEARGPIALDHYARLAEAAERGAQAEELSRGELPEAAWPHIHRVWIERTVKDFALAGLVRRAIAAERARAATGAR